MLTDRWVLWLEPSGATAASGSLLQNPPVDSVPPQEMSAYVVVVDGLWDELRV